MFRNMCDHSNGWRPEDGVPDLAMMSDITTEGINVNLRTRYMRDEIYTFSGSILIAVNPYKQLDIYNSEWVARYRQQKIDQTDPHVFALTEAMYMNLVMHDVSNHDSPSHDTRADSSSINRSSSIESNDQSRAINSTAIGFKNQACVISGESGAGKTETTKFILSYLCSVTPNKSIWMEHQILEANTILEAFGNAKTVRNDNSSRFGKFIQICFDSRHQINGCIIQDYLLEQSRITYQSIGERNYHVFYQLLAAGQTNEELRKKFHLMPANFFDYLNKTKCYSIDGINDCAMFDSLRTAMSVLNMDQESCDGLFSVLSAILWLGNLQFKCDENCQSEESQLTDNDREIISIVSEMLGVEQDRLEPIMLKRQINVRGSITEIPFKIHEARDNRNAMAKALYSRLFSWVVHFINASTNPGIDNTCFLGVLDIFGFENFDSNSFEQLCINYANEKLHKFFNQHMFAMEQELYKREGIEFCDINFTDNTPCLELLERPPNCILRLLSEECRMPKGSDATFIQKLHNEFTLVNPNPYYLKGNDRRNWASEFSVRHFAGIVTYNVNGFLKKNKDAQQRQLIDIIETSTNPLLHNIVTNESNSREKIPFSFNSSSRQDSNQRCTDFAAPSNSTANSSKLRIQNQQSFCATTSSECPGIGIRRESSFNFDSLKQAPNVNGSTKSKPTVADSFRHQLSSLVELLSNVNPWYVRCIKPNLEKSATDYDDRQVLMQLRYLGMSDLIRIRREGFPIHFTKHQFVCRYRCLMMKHQRLTSSSPIKLDDSSLDTYCRRMMAYFCLDQSEWRIGKTMVLLRQNSYQPLEEKRNHLFSEMATAIQSHWRGYVERRRYVKMKQSAIKIQNVFRAYRGRLQYLRKKRATLTIQAYCRGMFAREIASALREIKKAEKEAAAKLAREEAQRALDNEAAIKASSEQTKIVITDAQDSNEIDADHENLDQSKLPIAERDESPASNASPAISSNAYWRSSDPNNIGVHQKPINSRDKKEMEELIKVLERHGVSLDTVNIDSDKVYADFERLYDVLGNQLSINCDTQSISPSMNDDDRCSFMTTGTTCDGDTVSCSGQSQLSSTVTDDQMCNDETKGSENSTSVDKQTDSTKDETVNQNQGVSTHDSNDDKYHSNSIESIASIVSSNSMHYNQPNATQNSSDAVDSLAPSSMKLHNSEELNAKPIVQDPPARTSSFTGNPIVLSGSKMVTNGRPLARIEEEPNSIASSPSKTPNKPNFVRPQSLFPPKEDEENDPTNEQLTSETKRRRVERRILQVQQKEVQLPINPTTAGVPTSQSLNDFNKEQVKDEKTCDQATVSDNDIDTIYGVQKNNILEFAEQMFNNHPKDSSSGNSMMRTLTRRRRSVDSNNNDFLTKGEMLSYNSAFTIPTSHIRMHDPLSAQISCSIFKNLCKYMSGESAKNDTEVRIIQSIIRHGIERAELRDEIYIQIIRQLTNNPFNDYCLRLWTILGLVSAAFPPSKNFSKHLIAYLRSKPRKDPSITCYAQFCLDNLQAPRLSIRKYPPSLLEIQACKSLTTLTCKIHLLDGRCETLSVHPCDTTVDTLTKLAHKINLQSIEGWALYESYTPGASKYPHPTYEQKGDFEKTLKAHSYMADLIASWQEGLPKSTSVSLKIAQKRISEGNFKLTLKKRIFRGPKIRNDPVEINLLYAQAVHSVVKKDCFFVDENLALGLAGLQAQVNLGNAVDILKQDSSAKRGKVSKQTKATLKPPHHVYDFENYICVRLRNQATRSKKDWCNLIHQAHKQVHNVNEVFCKMRYLSMVIYHCPLYGTATFEVTYKGYQALDQNLMLGVNAEGLVLIRTSDKALISAYRYADICQEKGITVYSDENIIQINVKERSDGSVKCLSFESSENEEIATLMGSYSPGLPIYLRGQASLNHSSLESSFDQNIVKRKAKLKMTLEDRMRTHQEVQNARKAIVKSGKLRKPNREETQPGIFKHTLRKLSSTRAANEKPTRFESIYGTLGRIGGSQKLNNDHIPQTASDYNLYGSIGSQTITEDEAEHPPTEVAGATAVTDFDELTKAYPHTYWAYTRFPLRSSLLTIYDSDLEDAALTNFIGILTYSGLINPSASETASGASTLDSSSIDSGIASQPSLTNANGTKVSSGSPSSASSNDIYDVCPRKIDEKELIRLAQGILDKCLKKGADILKNELFLQLIKQTTDHPDPNSEINRRHWQLLALACSVTYPSDCRILSYLYAHLRRCSMDQVTDEGQYAQFTLRSLQGTLDTKGRRCAPSELEILSTINCRRVYARVYFLDGQFQAVEFDPCATIAEVVDQIKQKIGLKQDCNGYALVQPLDDDCEQVLQPEDKVGDAMADWENWHKAKQTKNNNRLNQQALAQNNSATNTINKASIASINANAKSKTHRFIFKKYLFLDTLNDLNDPVERELIYHQTVASIKEDKFPLLEQEATILCALKAQIEIGDYNKLANLPKEHIRVVYKQVIMSIMPPHAFNNLPVPAIAQQHQAFRELNCADAKKYFFNLIQSFGRANFVSNPGYILLHRSHVYDATQTFATAWPSDIWIAINQSGLHMLVARSRVCRLKRLQIKFR
jgi:myosin heavy subunit